MNNRYVGITGFMSRADVDACLDALPAGLILMCGVLASPKSLRGERNRWWRRYPKPEDIAGIFPDDTRCLNLIHYSTSEEPPSASTVSRLQELGGECCDGFQFNGVWPTPATLAALSGGTVVLQFNPRHAGLYEKLPAAVRALNHCDVHVLIDGSGGRGEPLDPDVCDAWAMTIRNRWGNDIDIGFAGGLCAEELPRLATEIRTWHANVDAEGRLRDGDEGGMLNLGKARTYLKAAAEVML